MRGGSVGPWRQSCATRYSIQPDGVHAPGMHQAPGSLLRLSERTAISLHPLRASSRSSWPSIPLPIRAHPCHRRFLLHDPIRTPFPHSTKYQPPPLRPTSLRAHLPTPADHFLLPSSFLINHSTIESLPKIALHDSWRSDCYSDSRGACPALDCTSVTPVYNELHDWRVSLSIVRESLPESRKAI